jgi:molecular chaperone HscA
VEVKPSYGLSDEQIEEMLIDALDRGDEDVEARRLAEARVEGARMLLATEKALASDADLLEGAERGRVEAAIADLRQAVDGSEASRIQMLMNELDDGTHDWAGRRMNRAIRAAIGGRDVEAVGRTVADAVGVEARLDEEAKAREELD